MPQADTQNKDSIVEAMQYLETGGLGEMLGMTSASFHAGHPKIQCDSDLALALCLLAAEALDARQKANPSGVSKTGTA